MHQQAAVKPKHEIDAALVRASQDEIAQAMASHSRPVLKFSGGKDSLACLYLLRPYWDRLTVLWANTGDPYPETVEQMAEVRQMVGRFVEVAGPGNVQRHGVDRTFPSDMVPWDATPIGRFVQPASAPNFTIHSFGDCCWVNMWQPMQQAIAQLGCDLVIRGERDSERYRPPVVSGMHDPQNGGTQLLPIYRWSKEDVFAFLRGEGVEIPRQYAYGMGSFDCLHCTAVLIENGNKLRYLRDFHPMVAVEYEHRLRLIHDEQERHMRLTKIALGELEPAGEEGLGD